MLGAGKSIWEWVAGVGLVDNHSKIHGFLPQKRGPKKRKWVLSGDRVT